MTSTLAGSHATPIGVLGVPVGAYVDLSDTLSTNEPVSSRVLEALLPFLQLYSSAIRRCMEDEYHWERMVFPFHPAEPDVLSVLFCVEATLRRRRQASLLSLFERVPLFHVAGNFLYNALLERFDETEEKIH